MALKGRFGIVELSRSTPEPVIIPTTAIERSNDRFTVEFEGFWPGDEVTLIHDAGASLVSGFAYIDELDRITLHTDILGAQENDPGTAVDLSGVPAGPGIVCLAPTAPQQAVLVALAGILAGVVIEEPLRKYPAASTSFWAADPGLPGWDFQGLMESWTLSLNAATADTTGLGERDATAVKTIATGSGNMNFVVDFVNNPNLLDSEPIFRLAMLFERGAKAAARFYLKQATQEFVSQDGPFVVARKNHPVFYKANTLITTTGVDVSSDSIVRGSADFITTGRVRLLNG